MQIDRTVNLTDQPDYKDRDVDYDKTRFNLFDIGLEVFFGKMCRDIGKVNRTIEETFKSTPKGITVVSLRIGVICDNDIRIDRDSKHRYWLGLNGKTFRLGGAGNYFDRKLLNKIETELGIGNVYTKQVMKEEIYFHVVGSIDIDKPSLLDKLLKRQKEFSFDTGGFKEGNWIRVKGYVIYNLFNRDRIIISVKEPVGLISRSLFPDIHKQRDYDTSYLDDIDYRDEISISWMVAETITDMIFK